MRKRILVIISLCAICLLSLITSAAEQDAYELQFEENEYGVDVTYCKLKKTVEQFVLPEEVNGKPVVAIASYAFSSFESSVPEIYAQHVILPDTIRVIEHDAMNKIYKAEKIHLPHSLEYIGAQALPSGYLCAAEWEPATDKYDFCDGFIIDTSTQTAIHCFSEAPDTVTIPEGVVELSDGLFAGWPLKQVHFPESLRVIGEGAFYECYQLTELTFPSNLMVIEPYAFGLCANISELSFPSTLMYIGEKAFHQHSISDYGALSQLTLNEGLLYIGDYCFAEHQLEKVVIPESVVFIGEGAFESKYEGTQYVGYEEPAW